MQTIRPRLWPAMQMHAGTDNRTARLTAIVFQFDSGEGHSLAM